ncbi:probable pectinesterase/pectinesterase inhibitor 46 [Musa acuminata AAA Group]|uniref:probable pectinesterase/pectinesterase inhibitor 46 n=1 Tax=Musa acuminata AAA Group TaxID=214697 RepID=UPI0031E1178B
MVMFKSSHPTSYYSHKSSSFMAWFRSYGRADDSIDAAALQARRATARRMAVIGVSALILIAVFVAATVSAASRRSDDRGPDDTGNTFSSSIKAACGATLYQEQCVRSLGPLANGSTLDPVKIFQLAVQITIDELSKVSAALDSVAHNESLDSYTAAALTECKDLMGFAIDHLNDTLSVTNFTAKDTVDDLKTWLSAAITDQYTCIEDMEGALPAVKTVVVESLANSTKFASNALAIFTEFTNFFRRFKLRRLMSFLNDDRDAFPAWLSSKDRKLLWSTDVRKDADIVVAKDCSGRYKTIKAALAAVPKKSRKRTVIYVKKGVYKENVKVDKTLWNVMMVGDGKAATIITGSRNVVDGTPTFQTATLAVFGKGFIARDMGIRNTAGAVKHQAVAMMSKSDQSVFYLCSFDAFQDTLYSHSLRQFFQECDITGTVDFIFGNAAVVYQRCNILPRAPMAGQPDTITAQGRVDPNQNTGISIHSCSIKPNGNVAGVRIYLGRPWKPYAVTVYMKSAMAGIIDPKGWLPWSGNSAPDTIFYSEYRNTGPGSSTKNRVKWKGVKTMTAAQANEFTVTPFVGGNLWLPKTGVPFTPGM